MPRPSISLHIAQPCAESWAAMTPASGGRHCAACQKTVVDFTYLTDAEILAHLAQVNGRACGRFRAEQLGQPLWPAAPAEPSRWRIWLGALLAVGSLGPLLAPKAAAQTAVRGSAGPLPLAAATQAPAAAAGQPAAQPAAAPPLQGPRTLTGTVLDQASLEPLPGATVLLKGTPLGTNTNADGTFSLTIPDDAPTAQLVFVYIGYRTAEQTVALANRSPLAVLLDADARVMLGEVVYVPAKRPWPWHPRRLYYWGKAQLTRPFRQ